MAWLDLIVLDPARFQAKHLGRQYGTVLNMTSFMQSGFQDPVSDYHYLLSDAEATELRKRCIGPLTYPGGEKVEGCRLYSYMDDRIAEDITLTGNELWIQEGLW